MHYTRRRRVESRRELPVAMPVGGHFGGELGPPVGQLGAATSIGVAPDDAASAGN